MHTFQIRATTATWWDTSVIVACEDLSVKCVSFELKAVLCEFQIGAPATSICKFDSTVVVGLKTGRCEVWTISDEMICKKRAECVVGRGDKPILSAHWVFNLYIWLT